MVIRCPHCQFSRSITLEKIPSTAEIATCPRCNQRFRFRTISKKNIETSQEAELADSSLQTQYHTDPEHDVAEHITTGQADSFKQAESFRQTGGNSGKAAADQRHNLKSSNWTSKSATVKKDIWDALSSIGKLLEKEKGKESGVPEPAEGFDAPYTKPIEQTGNFDSTSHRQQSFNQQGFKKESLIPSDNKALYNQTADAAPERLPNKPDQEAVQPSGSHTLSAGHAIHATAIPPADEDIELHVHYVDGKATTFRNPWAKKTPEQVDEPSEIFADKSLRHTMHRDNGGELHNSPYGPGSQESQNSPYQPVPQPRPAGTQEQKQEKLSTHQAYDETDLPHSAPAEALSDQHLNPAIAEKKVPSSYITETAAIDENKPFQEKSDSASKAEETENDTPHNGIDIESPLESSTVAADVEGNDTPVLSETEKSLPLFAHTVTQQKQPHTVPSETTAESSSIRTSAADFHATDTVAAEPHALDTPEDDTHVSNDHVADASADTSGQTSQKPPETVSPSLADIHPANIPFAYSDLTPEELVEKDILLLRTDMARPTKDLGILNETAHEHDPSSFNETREIPWEHPGAYGIFSSFARTIKNVMFSAPAFFRTMPSTGGLPFAFLFFILLGYLAVLCTTLWIILASVLLDIPSLANVKFFVPVIALFTPVGLGLLLIACTSCTRIFLILFKSPQASFSFTFKLLCYSIAPIILSVIPFVGPLAGLAWSCVALATACHHSTGLSPIRSVIAVLPACLLIVGSLFFLL